MTQHFVVVEIKRSRGGLVLNGYGQTGRGQRFIKDHVRINADSFAAPSFKDEVALAMTKLTGEPL